MTETIDAAGAATLMLCSEAEVESEARLGNIPGLKIGRSWLFVTADLLAFLSERARIEAADRRAKCSPAKNVQPIKQLKQLKLRRRVAPALPVLPSTAG
jgi:hypothetical protein